MTSNGLPPRSAIPVEFTWNAASVFPSHEAWDAAFKHITADIGTLDAWRGHIADGPAAAADALAASEALMARTGQVMTYAMLAQAVDTGDADATRMASRAQGLFGQVLGAVAFVAPELVAVGGETLQQWLGAEPRLAVYAHYINDLLRRAAHLRSGEVEQVLGMVADPFGGTYQVVDMLVNADMKFAPAVGSDGQSIPITPTTIIDVMLGADRTARRTAFENYYDGYLAFKNTFASSLVTSIKQNVFRMRVRGYPSTLEANLSVMNLPPSVFHNLIATFRKNLPTWHRFFEVRRRALGVETLHPYDMWAPLTARRPHMPFKAAVDWICEGLAPLGEDYVTIMRRGCLEERWIDLLPNQGKVGGAFSAGTHGTYPFIVMSYRDDTMSMSTLAHELGHSMHSYLTWQHQPVVYGEYSMFVAEVASNFHQAMVRAHLLAHNSDPDFQLSVIEEAMFNFYRYFFIMPTLARFELETHERLERGEGLNADDMIEMMADLFAEGFGSAVEFDRTRVGMTWATFPHLYEDYYVFQYATGIAAAHALAQRILDGEPGAAAAYRQFLHAGGSLYPLDALRLAGADMTQPEPVDRGFAIMAGLVDRLEALVDARKG